MNKDVALGTLFLFVLFIAGLAPLTLAFLPQLFGILGCVVIGVRGHNPIWNNKRFLLLLASIPLMIILSGFWSINPIHSVLRGLKIGLLFASYIPLLYVLINLPVKCSEFIKSYFSIPLIIIAAFVCIELYFGFPIKLLITQSSEYFQLYELNKNVAGLILLTPFAVLFSLQRKSFADIAILGCLILLVLNVTASQASQLGMAVMIIAIIGLRIFPRIALPLCFLACAGLLFSMPWLSLYLYNQFASQAAEIDFLRNASAGARFEVWDFVSRKILEGPLMGLGVDTTRFIQFDNPMLYFKNKSVLHPHSIALQLWIEFGYLGPIIGSFFLFRIFNHLKNISIQERYLALAVVVGTITFLLVSWSIWASWFIGLMLLLTCLIHFSTTPNRPCRFI